MKCKCPPGVLQVPSEGGLPTYESFLHALQLPFKSVNSCDFNLSDDDKEQIYCQADYP